MKQNSFGQGVVIFLVVIGIFYFIGAVSEASEPKCIKAGCDNKQARDSSYCYLHKPYTGSSSSHSGSSYSNKSSSTSSSSSAGSSNSSSVNKSTTTNSSSYSTIKVLKRLNNNTTESGPVKGLVIGNVQSGKTANMAALMAMAADWGWNMFIILSGTIENLRMQTQTRLFNDLNQQGNIFWNPLEHLAKNVDLGKRTQDLHFDENSKTRYFTVCLKNSTRLKNLIEWSQADKNKQRQMKILVIDDEADQAGINTGHVDDEEERRRISKLIC